MVHVSVPWDGLCFGIVSMLVGCLHVGACGLMAWRIWVCVYGACALQLNSYQMPCLVTICREADKLEQQEEENKNHGKCDIAH